MKLLRARVQNFRSIEDTGIFSFDDLTCLVGKNEAGKTAILQALHALRPVNPLIQKFDVTKDYPRRFSTKYKERHQDGEAVVITTWWELADKTHKALTDEFGENAITANELIISKHYNEDTCRWTIPLDEAKCVENLIVKTGMTAEETAPLSGIKSVKKLIDTLNAIASRTEKHSALLNVVNAYPEQSSLKKAFQILDPLVPKFFYTSHYDRMNGDISVNQLAHDRGQNKVSTSDKIFLNFLQLAGTPLEELQASNRYEDLSAKCEAASNEITDQMFKYWKQNDALLVRLEFSEGRAGDPPPFNAGTVVRARVHNILHRATVPFSERSAGFVWFFSFLVQFAAMRREIGNTIILLDEPGLTLHGKAQADLLEYMEKELLPHHQVAYSTHSPFLVPPDRFTSVRIVEDVIIRGTDNRPEVKGTKVSEDALVTDPDTLFPLQGALGFDITQTLFVGKHTLLVEGPSDILYLQALSNALKKQDRTGLDPKWTLCPSGGIGSIKSFVTLFGGHKLDIAVLADQTNGEKKKIEDLRRHQVLDASRILTIADFTGKSESDVEDLFEVPLFVEVVNRAYDLSQANKLTAESLVKANPNTPRQVIQVEAAFNTMPDTIPTYDHFTPAAWLLENLTILDGDTPAVYATLDRAEKLFAVLNGLLRNERKTAAAA